MQSMKQLAAKIVPRSKMYWLEYSVTYERNRARITSAAAVRMSDMKRKDWSGYDLLDDLIQWFTNSGAKYVFVWGISYIGAFLDYYALKNGLPLLEDAQKVKGSRRPAEPCYTCLYAAGHGVLNVRLTLRRTAKTHDYGGGKIGGLHTVEYRGLRPFYGTERREKAQKAAGLTEDFTPENGAALYAAWVKAFENMAQENVEALHYMRKVYTIGGAARRKYLRVRYGKDSLRTYQQDHPQSELQEDYFRRCRLLLSGMIIAPQWGRGVLDHGTIYKYDVNGLYSDTANKVGDLGVPEPCGLEEFFNERSGKYTYIAIVRGVSMYRNPGMSPVFVNPFTRRYVNHIEIDQSYAVFRELWEELEKFYQIDEVDFVCCYRLKKLRDPAIREYNDFFQEKKAAAGKAGDEVARMVAKLFLNNIIGKFAQHTKYMKQIAEYNVENDCVYFKTGELVNNWKKGHFHFLRGAYIYTMARVRVMQDIRSMFDEKQRGEAHHFYTDTDSIVTDIKMPPDMINEFELGKYKIEKIYSDFAVFAPKVYYARTLDGADELTAAGIEKGVILRQLREERGDDLTAGEVFAALSDRSRSWIIENVVRTSGGAAKIPCSVRLSEIDIDKML